MHFRKMHFRNLGKLRSGEAPADLSEVHAALQDFYGKRVGRVAGVAPDRVEGFDRRGIEPFEFFRSEFGQNSLKIVEILLEFIRND